MQMHAKSSLGEQISIATDLGAGLRVEPLNQPVEACLEFRVVVVRMFADERDDFPIVIGRLPVIASGLADLAEAVVAVMHLGIAFQEVVCGTFRLVEVSGADQGESGVGCGGQSVVDGIGQKIGKEVAPVRTRERPLGGGAGRARGFLVLGETALLVFLATAARAGFIASGFGHLGNFILREGRTTLYQNLLADARFHGQLLVFDDDMAKTARKAPCRHCGGVLHSARYKRKPRGKPAGLGEAYDVRFSFCCAVGGCRGRATPPSLRFLGRKVYLASMVVLIATMQHGATPARLSQLTQFLNISPRTVRRWRTWWLETFVATDFWRVASARLMPPANPLRLPASLLERFEGTLEEQLLALLKFLGPITGGAGQAF